MDSLDKVFNNIIAVVSKQLTNNAWNILCLISLVSLVKLRYGNEHRIGYALSSFMILKLSAMLQ